MNKTGLIVFCILVLWFSNCSKAQNLIKISENISLEQVGQELIGEELESEFGRRIATNEIGNIIVVSSREAGKAFVYRLQNGVWNQLGQTLERKHCRWFGFELDVSGDGKTVAIGSESEGIFIYKYVNGKWDFKGDPLLPEKYSWGIGRTLELSDDGNRIAFTAYTAESKKGIVDAGAAYILEFKDNSWEQKGNIIYGDLAGHQMGYDMSFSKGGDQIVISSPYHKYRYTKSYKLIGNLWKQIGEDINPKEKKDGWRIKMNDEGDKILSYNGENKIYLHILKSDTWEEVEFQEGTNFIQDYGYGFEFIPLSSLVLVSNPTSENSEKGLGELFFFDLKSKNNLKPLGSLKESDNTNYFGYDLDVSSNGKRLVIGSMGVDNKGFGSVKVYEIIRN